jgi:hypothetical protein
MAIVNGVLIFSFISRALYQFIAIFGIYHLPNIPIQVLYYLLELRRYALI